MMWPQFRKTKKALDTLPVTAKAVVTTRGGKILLLRKSDKPLHDLPGGRIEAGEDLFAGLKREIHEETGLQLKTFYFVASWIKEQQDTPPRLMLVFKAPVRLPARKLMISLSEEHEWGRFLAPEKAAKKAMDAGYRHAIISADRMTLKHQKA